MKDIAIYGAGGFGREVACLLRIVNESSPQWNFIGFFDDNQSLWGRKISRFGTCLGGIDSLNSYPGESLSIVIAVGNAHDVQRIQTAIFHNGIDFPNIVHPNLILPDPDSFQMGRGNIVQSNCTFSCDVSIGDFNNFNGSVVLGHDVRVGSFNQFMPAVRVSGEVQIGDGNFFGVGSIVLQRIRIGTGVRIGAGSVLMLKPKDNTLYIGNPAKKMNI